MRKAMIVTVAACLSAAGVALGSGEEFTHFICVERPTKEPHKAVVESVARAHFVAVAKGDAAAIRALWNTHFGVVEKLTLPARPGATFERSAMKLEDAITIWTTDPDAAAEAKIVKTELYSEDGARVTAEFAWKGAVYHEVLTLVRQGRGEGWVLVQKSYYEKTPPKKSNGGY